MSLSAVTAFWLVTFLLILAPGADWAFTLAAALRGDAVPAAVGGLATGYGGMTVVVAAGVGALVAGSPPALTAITLLGGGYLVWLGIGTWRHPATSAPFGDAAAARSWRSTYAEGIGVSGMNPKGLLIFVALLPQFTDPRAAWPVAVQLAVLGLAFTATAAAFYLVLGSFARGVLRASPRAARTLSRISALGMVFIGSALIGQRLLG